jgi:hypothetical protein
MKFDVTFTLTHPATATATIEADSLTAAQAVAGAMKVDDPRITLTPSDGDLTVDDIEQRDHAPEQP